MATLQEAFSATPYLQFADQGYDAVVRAALSDFSGLIQESTCIPTIYRMEASKSQVNWQVMVPDPKESKKYSFQTYSKDLSSHLSEDPTKDATEKIARITANPKNYVPNARLGKNTCMYLWMSPAQPEKFKEYKESRVEIGILTHDPKTNTYSGDVISNIAPDWTQTDCATNFDIFRGFHTPSTPDQIRNTPLVLSPPKDQDPLEWFSHASGLDHIAADYKSGKLHEQQHEIMEQITTEASMFAIAVMTLAKTGVETQTSNVVLYDSVKKAAGGEISSTCFYEATSSNMFGSSTDIDPHIANGGTYNYEVYIKTPWHWDRVKCKPQVVQVCPYPNCGQVYGGRELPVGFRCSCKQIFWGLC